MIDLSTMLNVPDLPIILKRVDKCLLEAVQSKNVAINKACARIIQAGGKRLRPSLVITCFKASGQSISEDIIKLAAAVELLHIGSLVHDDIIDEADTRHSIPTINSKEGVNEAIVIGDYLLALACKLAAQVGKKEARLVADTIIKLCEGQYLELSDQFNIKRTELAYYNSIEGKTAALLSLSCALGGMSSGVNLKQVKQLQEYGRNFGFSFQLLDDLMDIVSSEKLYGKPVGNDIAEGIYTLPIILGLKSSQSSKIKKILATKKYDHDLLTLLIQSGSVKASLLAIDKYNQQAESALKSFKNQNNLQKLPSQYTSWAIQNLVSPSYQSISIKLAEA